MKEVDVLIVGAGMSGLSAGFQIHKENKNILLIEGRNRIGGRLSSEKFDDGLLFERGGGMIHGTKNKVYDLVKELGIEIQELQNEGKESSMVEKVVYSLLRVFIKLGIYPKANINENLAEYINRLKFIPKSKKIELNNLSKDFENFDKVSALHIIDRMKRQFLQGEMYGDRDFIIKEGYVSVLNYLAKDLPIEFNQKVKSINWQKDRVLVETNNETIKAKKVISTLPIPILKHIRFVPDLPKEKQIALDAHVTGDILKVIIPLPKKAFKTKDDSGEIDSAKITPMWWRRNLSENKDEDRQILVGWITGPYARNYLKHSSKDSLDKMLNDLSKIVDINLIDKNEIIVQNWMKDEFSQGTYCYIKPGFGLDIVEDLRKPLDKKLFFAGTATADESGTAHGAYESGLKVAKEVLM